MNVAPVLMLALAGAAAGDVIVHDNRGTDSYEPIVSCFDGSASFGRLDPTLTPTENALLECAGSLGAGVLELVALGPATSCSGGEYAVYASGGSAVFANTGTTEIVICPDEGDLATPVEYIQAVDLAPSDSIGPGAAPGGTQWRFSAVLQDLAFSVSEHLDPPAFVGVRLVRAGETRYGWLQFSEPDDFQNINLLAWGYESDAEMSVSPIDVETITRGPDLNGDSLVNSSDLAELLAKWGATGPVVIPTASGGAYVDIDGDGFVGSGDLATLLAAWSTP